MITAALIDEPEQRTYFRGHEITLGTLYAFHVRLGLEQLVALQTDEAEEAPLAYASTWDIGATGTIPVTQVTALRQVVRDLVMQFIKDWAQ